jgi:hypothetical protein
MTTTQTITLPVTLAGSTRQIEFTVAVHGESAWSNGQVATCRIGRGEKLHKAPIAAWHFDSPEAARKRGYRAADLTPAADGGVWGVSDAMTVRNRQATIIGWSDEAPEALQSQHVAYSGFGAR